MGSSSGPNIKLLERFCTVWKDIDRNSHESGMKDECIVKKMEQVKEELKQFFHSHWMLIIPGLTTKNCYN